MFIIFGVLGGSRMQIQVHTTNQLDGSSQLSEQVQEDLELTLARFQERITRIEVHFSDENSHKGGAEDKRCVMEARVSGLRPLSVSNGASTLSESYQGAIKKLEKVLRRTLGRLDDQKNTSAEIVL
jgi:ribosome-associated translation inhibitor RaiA